MTHFINTGSPSTSDSTSISNQEEMKNNCCTACFQKLISGSDGTLDTNKLGNISVVVFIIIGLIAGITVGVLTASPLIGISIVIAVCIASALGILARHCLNKKLKDLTDQANRDLSSTHPGSISSTRRSSEKKESTTTPATAQRSPRPLRDSRLASLEQRTDKLSESAVNFHRTAAALEERAKADASQGMKGQFMSLFKKKQ